ncbi:MAG TPA: peptidoglycan DD-metalloendopeptidase family protein [Rudaea sp.]|nr:peptidoglycan DD-metalloendopeptidase family protein [Rudaea sp.]
MTHYRSPRLHGLAALCALVLGACASDPAPVEDRSIGPAAPERTDRAAAEVERAPAAGTYRVVKGDTLYSIAFKHGLDFRDLAAWNGIGSPYRIYVGQELRLSSDGAAVTSAAPERTAPAAVPIAQSPHVDFAPAPKPVAAAPARAAPTPVPESAAKPAEKPIEKPGQTSTAEVAPAPKPAAPAEAPAEAATPPVAPAGTASAAQLTAGGVTWRWPGEGKVVGTYVAGDQTKQGIDIAGKAGEPVRAAADGEVVYSGNGLLGYGELVIIKHNASFLSAYGHNRRRLVQEGDKVKAGQQIAEMGEGAGARDELHFEIRKNGKPVNPLDYLPAR